MTQLARSRDKWRADHIRKELAGMVAYEFSMVEGAPTHLPFKPRVEFWEENEPEPWTVVF